MFGFNIIDLTLLLHSKILFIIEGAVFCVGQVLILILLGGAWMGWGEHIVKDTVLFMFV